jgi:hypothetical protein
MALLLAALLFAAPVPPEAQPQPQSTHANAGLIAGGAVVTYVAYGIPLAVAAVYGILVVPFIAAAHADVPTQPFLLLIPVAGPIALNQTDAFRNGSWRNSRTLFYVDAAAQAIGFTMLIAGFASRTPDAADWRPYAGPLGAGVVRRF